MTLDLRLKDIIEPGKIVNIHGLSLKLRFYLFQA